MSTFLYEARVKIHGPQMDEARLDELVEQFENELLAVRIRIERKYDVETELET